MTRTGRCPVLSLHDFPGTTPLPHAPPSHLHPLPLLPHALPLPRRLPLPLPLPLANDLKKQGE